MPLDEPILRATDPGPADAAGPRAIVSPIIAVTVVAIVTLRVVSGFRAGVPLGIFAMVQSAALIAVAWVIARLALNVSGGSRRAARWAFCIALITGALTGQWAEHIITQAGPPTTQLHQNPPRAGRGL